MMAAQGLFAQAGTSPAAAATPASAVPPAVAATPTPAPSSKPLVFEVSTVKPSKPQMGDSMMMFTADGVSITGIPLRMVIREAFGIEDDRIIGEPGWVKSSSFDIEAKVAAEDVPRLKGISFDQRRQMLIPLLEERFGLKIHHETREMPEYDLVIAKGGVKMNASKPDDPPGHGQHMLMSGGSGHIESQGTGTQPLAHLLSSQLGRSVEDKTGLTGNYDYKLDWTPDDAAATAAQAADGGQPGAGNATPPDTPGPSLFTALQEQLGLKLEPRKGSVDVIVIDHIEQPSAN
jgi:uncharacterized protein (TIGR03435 family)